MNGVAGVSMLVAILLLAIPAHAQQAEWSAGIMTTVNILGPKVVEAMVDEAGILQPVKIQDVMIRPVIETHVAWPVSSRVSIGPFASVALGDDIISAIGGGIVVEFGKRFNLGLGYWVDPSARTLRPDFVIGQPAPSRNIQYVERAVGSLAIMVGVPLP